VTELELAIEFVKAFSARVIAVIKTGLPVDERAAFDGFCAEQGAEPTAERLELARDVVLVLRELRASGEDAAVDAADLGAAVTARRIFTGLEVHGWRRAFLGKDVRI
jgi:hypothetical protein